MNARLSAGADLASARTLLFVPGNRPDRFAKALNAGADAVVIDLEDAVPAALKDEARAALIQAWPGLRGQPVVVRCNAWSETDARAQDAWEADLACLSALPGLPAVMLPKAESAQSVQALCDALGGIAVLPLIETAAGHAALDAVAAAPGVLRLVLGHIDFMADTGIECSDDEAELAPLRFAIAMATRRAGLAPAVDGVTVQTNDAARLAADTARTRRFGFGGKLCIHPGQIAGVHAALAPSQAQQDWAKRVVEADAAAGGAAVRLDGAMIDAPVVARARRILAQAVRGGANGTG